MVLSDGARHGAASAGCRCRSTAAGWYWPPPMRPACGRRWRRHCAAASRASGIAVAAPAHLLLAEPMAAAEWWPAVRSGTVRMVSLGAEEGAADRQFLARLWRCGVASGHITLEELASLLSWHPARLLGLQTKGRLHPGCDADLAVLDPEAPATGDEARSATRSRGWRRWRPGARRGGSAARCGRAGAAWRGGRRRQAGPLDWRHRGARAAVRTHTDGPGGYSAGSIAPWPSTGQTGAPTASHFPVVLTVYPRVTHVQWIIREPDPERAHRPRPG